MFTTVMMTLLLGQAPLGVGGVQEHLIPNYPAANYIQHIFVKKPTNGGDGCLMFSNNGLGWVCLMERGENADTATFATTAGTATTSTTAVSATTSITSDGVRALASAPSSPDPGATYLDTTKGCIQTWAGAAWTPATCPLLSVQPYPSPPNTLGDPASSDPVGVNTGYTYWNTVSACFRTWSGSSWLATGCVSPDVPALPSWSASLNFDSVSAGDCDYLTFTASGGVAGEAVACGGKSSVWAVADDYETDCSISSTNTAQVQLCCGNLLLACADPPPITFSVSAIR